MSNAFLEVADRLMVGPRKAKHRAAEKRAATLAMRKAEEEADLLRSSYEKWRRDQEEALLSGPLGQRLSAVVTYLDAMTLADGDDLIARVECATWLREADRDMRFWVLRLIDDAIVRLRERYDLPPFDDPLPGAPPNVFLSVREMLQ